MNAYLTKFKYRNAFTVDLWEALETASGKPVAAVMTTWTKQMGFPVIKVCTILSQCHLIHIRCGSLVGSEAAWAASGPKTPPPTHTSGAFLHEDLVMIFFFMPPTLKKWGAYCFRLVRLSVRLKKV